MAIQKISIRGARQHNLKNISVEIPRNTLTVITGLSGSGKSSLAFDTIYAEGQRRYVETLSAYARQFLDQMERPDVDTVEGLSPAISIEQQTASRSPRSTVGTITEIYDYLRLLYATTGIPHCPDCGKPISRQSAEQIVEQLLSLPGNERVMILAPLVRGRKGEFKKELEKLAREGFVRARIDGVLHTLEEPIRLDKRKNHTLEVVVDRLLVRPGSEKRIENSVHTALKLANGLVQVAVIGGKEVLYSERLACPDCGTSLPAFEPRSFSFNSKYGACPACQGLGSKWDFDPAKVIADWSKPLLQGGLGPAFGSPYWLRALAEAAADQSFDLRTPFGELPKKVQNLILYGKPYNGQPLRIGFAGIFPLLRQNYEDTGSDSYREWLTQFMSPAPCGACQGKRLRPESLAVRFNDLSISDLTALPVTRMAEKMGKARLSGREEKIAGRIVGEIRDRLEFLMAVGLGYLSLDRAAPTLSGGESQRIRLAAQIGSKLRGVLYVLDEPSIGLHHRDNARLFETLENLRDLGNTVLVVEHDEDTIRRADYVVDLGPGAGRQGGYLVVAGPPAQIAATESSLTGQYMAGKLAIPVPPLRRRPNGKFLTVQAARANNLKNVDVSFPLGLLIVVTGVSGSGKSTLVNDILYRAMAQKLYGAKEEPGLHGRIEGAEQIDKVICIDQSPIGRTPRSNPATYTGVFTPIRELFAVLPESRERGYRAGRFSFNVRGGRCEACQGDGQRRIEMNFLPDVFVTCDICRGRRYNSETLAVKYKGYPIADILESTVQDSLEILENIPQVTQKLKTLVDVGLGYLHLGQSSTTLSGGEAQRIKLARELSRRQTGRTLYILDEPTTGLHFDDVRKLLEVLNRLTDLGNTVIIIEHNLDVVKTADWVIDLGPEGGEAGGRVVAQGPPEQVARVARSFTGQALARVLSRPLPSRPEHARTSA
ncbi:MAG: excinuclease ABC subunit A [Acidobacteria bacterium RIFCSPLOWO2_12_FULL_59_11]|nr:MAG: excinuclease ABC subunit A [Acidobacteria bacterium RIFCSPLOWO2_12_FULL_59_11]